MAPSSRDRISVDLHGLRAPLIEHAQAQRISVSVLVRRALERELSLAEEAREPIGTTGTAPIVGQRVKLSMRLTAAEVSEFDGAARRAGLSRGAFLAGLMAGVPSLSGGAGTRATRPEYLAALTASCAELSTLTRNIHHLTALLRQGDVRPAQQYRRMLDTLADDVREHLKLAAGVLAELRPARSSTGSQDSARPLAA